MFDINEVMISGTINNISDTNNQYIKFGLTTIKYDNGKVYSSLNINRNLYEIYKDFFVKGNKVYIKGYLNSYSLDNYDDILKGRKAPHLRCDPDGVLVWNGKRTERIPSTQEELYEINELLSEFK